MQHVLADWFYFLAYCAEHPQTPIKTDCVKSASTFSFFLQVMWTSGTDAAISQNLHMYTTMLHALWWREILWMESVDVNEHPTTFWMYRCFSPLKGFCKLRDPPCSLRWFSFQLFKGCSGQGQMYSLVHLWSTFHHSRVPLWAALNTYREMLYKNGNFETSMSLYMQRDALKEQQLWNFDEFTPPPPPTCHDPSQ